jgi:hypothetical protein
MGIYLDIRQWIGSLHHVFLKWVRNGGNGGKKQRCPSNRRRITEKGLLLQIISKVHFINHDLFDYSASSGRVGYQYPLYRVRERPDDKRLSDASGLPPENNRVVFEGAALETPTDRLYAFKGLFVPSS